MRVAAISVFERPTGLQWLFIALCYSAALLLPQRSSCFSLSPSHSIGNAGGSGHHTRKLIALQGPPPLLLKRGQLSAPHGSKLRLSDSVSTHSDPDDSSQNTRSKLRQITGFSVTALRGTLRATTGFSLTAFRTTVRAATGISLSKTIRETMRWVLGLMPAGVRYFLQPFLIMYYAPMITMRYWVGPTRHYREESLKGHEKMVEGWRSAVEAAEKAQSDGYWPVHLNDDGTITASLPPDPDNLLDLTDAIEKSVAVTASEKEY